MTGTSALAVPATDEDWGSPASVGSGSSGGAKSSVGGKSPPFKLKWIQDAAKADLGQRLFAVAVAMASYADGDGTGIRPSQQTIADGIGVSERQVRGALRDLEARGVLVMVCEAPRSSRRCNEYRLGVLPASVIEAKRKERERKRKVAVPANADTSIPAENDALVPANADASVPADRDISIPAESDTLVPADRDTSNGRNLPTTTSGTTSGSTTSTLTTSLPTTPEGTTSPMTTSPTTTASSSDGYRSAKERELLAEAETLEAMGWKTQASDLRAQAAVLKVERLERRARVPGFD
ncbi:helix-turn-helix protein [Jatrophihabitans sp. GAS493]|uniref:helix-turn-helix domain-containing protein n=1 Tax=Jatrophihabitans sp. GAS493 TaxID=1907575 RepID=UPI000BBFA4BC|nr:helix-turn-helix protein [Jatrophihabitans sp. GAS493]